MAKITRYGGNLKAFASEQNTNERTVFGSETVDDSLDANINADFLRGWGIVPPSGEPTLEDFNAAFYTLGQILAYLHQAGVAEWHAEQEYFEGSLALTSSGVYRSLTAANIGNAPATSSANWEPLVTAANLPDATTATRGLTEYSTDAEAITKALGTRALTPANLAALGATNDLAGLIELATAAEAQELSDAVRALTPATLADAFQGGNQDLSVAAAAGYQILPGGLIIQLCSVSTGTANPAQVSYPIAFPNGPIAFAFMPTASGGSPGAIMCVSYNLTTTSIEIDRRTYTSASSTVGGRLIVIGY